jgi:hypothetical protein
MEHTFMGSAFVNQRIVVLAGLLLLSLSLGGCATSTGSSVMDARAEAPKADSYLPVEDLPPNRDKPTMTVDERSKLQKELIAARDRQASKLKTRQSAAPPRSVTP